MRRNVVVVGASAGGIEPLEALLSHLPADLPAAVLVVVHTGSRHRFVLPRMLDRTSALPVARAQDHEPLRHRRIYVAPPDHHLMIEDEHLRVVRGPKENRQRPSIDALFRSAAVCCGERVIGIVLSGLLDDGTAGLWAIKWRGGVAVVQEPGDARFSDMPVNALNQVEIDYVVPISEMAPLVARLVHEAPRVTTHQVTDTMQRENDAMVEDGNGNEEREREVPPGKPSTLTCPECHGALWEVDDEGPLRYRCRVGHGFSTDSLLEEQSVSAEAALWAAVRSLDETAAFAATMQERMTARGSHQLARRFEERARTTAQHAATIRSILGRQDTMLSVGAGVERDG